VRGGHRFFCPCLVDFLVGCGFGPCVLARLFVGGGAAAAGVVDSCGGDALEAVPVDSAFAGSFVPPRLGPSLLKSTTEVPK
jgi:hypothetical protein